MIPRQQDFSADGVAWRLLFARFFVTFFLLILVARLWYLQALMGGSFRDLSENNRTRRIRADAPRGNIFDRYGRLLVSNRPSFDVALMLEDIGDLNSVVDELGNLSGKERKDLEGRLKNAKSSRPFEPKVVLRDINRGELARISAHQYRLPGVMIEVRPQRKYPYGSLAAQLLGYTREISKTQLQSLRSEGYQAGMYIGQSGIEKMFEPYLRGSHGYTQVEVDARGHRRRELGIKRYRVGHDIYLAIDLDLQLIAEKALGEHHGAVVGIEPNTGEILVLATSPSFDANMFSGEVSQKAWDELSKDPGRPLSNRSYASAYPPGSTFKLLLAAAGLEEGVIDNKSSYKCPGYYSFAGRRYHCHKRSGHGNVSLRRAITESCNAFFYQLGLELGIDRIHDYAKRFGLGKASDLGLPGEREGIVPSDEWKKREVGERWYPGETLSVAIGQGFLEASPLQIAVAVSALVNGGRLIQPRLLSRVMTRGGEEEILRSSAKKRSINISSAALEEVKTAMLSVVEDERGTGRRAALEGVRIGGKTGTAQVRSLKKSGNPEDELDHAWFVSAAPMDNPSLVLAVFVEHGGHGGIAAAPIARKIFKTHFEKRGYSFPEENDKVVEDDSGVDSE